jgi:hypothetical protein
MDVPGDGGQSVGGAARSGGRLPHRLPAQRAHSSVGDEPAGVTRAEASPSSATGTQVLQRKSCASMGAALPRTRQLKHATPV